MIRSGTTLILLGGLVACSGGGEPAPASQPSPGGERGMHAEHGKHAKHGGEHGEHGKHAKHGGEHGMHPPGATVDHRFEDAEKWAKVFDNPERDAWQKPAELVAAVGLEAGWTVADIGAGTGYLGPHLVDAVGPDGHVILADVESSLVTHMKGRFQGVDTVSVRKIDSDKPGLLEGEVNAVMLLDVVHHIGDRAAWFSELKPALKPGGKVIIVDFKEGELPVGPPPEHRLPVATVEAELAQAGFVVSAAPDVLPHQYVRVFSVR